MNAQLKKKLIPAALVVAVLVLGYVAWQKMLPTGPGEGFAKGAVLAASWLVGKKGVFDMKDVLFN